MHHPISTQYNTPARGAGMAVTVEQLIFTLLVIINHSQFTGDVMKMLLGKELLFFLILKYVKRDSLKTFGILH